MKKMNNTLFMRFQSLQIKNLSKNQKLKRRKVLIILRQYFLKQIKLLRKNSINFSFKKTLQIHIQMLKDKLLMNTRKDWQQKENKLQTVP